MERAKPRETTPHPAPDRLSFRRMDSPAAKKLKQTGLAFGSRLTLTGVPQPLAWHAPAKKRAGSAAAADARTVRHVPEAPYGEPFSKLAAANFRPPKVVVDSEKPIEFRLCVKSVGTFGTLVMSELIVRDTEVEVEARRAVYEEERAEAQPRVRGSGAGSTLIHDARENRWQGEGKDRSQRDVLQCHPEPCGTEGAGIRALQG